MKKKILTVLAVAAAIFCHYDAAAGLIDHGDVTGFPNVNVDAHILRIAKLYFPEVRQTLPVGQDSWVVQTWRDEIAHKVKAKNLNIPKEKLDAFIKYASYGRNRRPEEIVSAPHPELLEFELFARGAGEMAKRITHKEMPEPWKKLLALPLKDRLYTTIPVYYAFHNQRENRRQHLAESIAKALEALNAGCRDTQGCVLALCKLDGVWNYDLPPITEKSPLEDRILQYHWDLRSYTVNYVPEKVWRWTNDMDIWCRYYARGDKFYGGDYLMNNVLYRLTLESEEELRKLAEKDPLMRDLIVAVGLTCSDVPKVRAVALEFAGKSEINLPILAQKSGYDEAKKLLAGKKEHAALLDLMKIKQLNGEAKIAAIDSYIATYPDYTEADMPRTSIALNTHQELNALAALELVKLGRYEEALLRWLKGSTLEDAAIIAEQIMTTDQLLEFCKKHTRNIYPSHKFFSFSRHCAKGDHPFDFYILDERFIHELVRNILARRLMRENRSAEARDWFTGPATRAITEEYFKAEEQFKNAKTDPEKLDATLRMAALLRFKGDKICGTCLEPDNLICYGNYACVWGIKMEGLKLNKVDLPRYSYRYRAAELYRKAATFTQDRAIQAACYYTAGLLLRIPAREIAEADFKKLAQIAPELTRKNWFMPLRGVPPEVQAFNNRKVFTYSVGGIRNLKLPLPVVPAVKLPVIVEGKDTATEIDTEELFLAAVKEYAKDDARTWTIDQLHYAFYLVGQRGKSRGYLYCGFIERGEKNNEFNAMAFFLAKLAAAPESEHALLNAGDIYLEWGYPAEGLEMMRRITTIKDCGKVACASAAYILADHYYSGTKGVARDLSKALFYIIKARNAGHTSTRELEQDIMNAIQKSGQN